MNSNLTQKTKLLVLFVLAMIWFGSAVAQQKITIEQAVQLALENNIQLKQAQFNVALGEEDLKQSRWSLTPSLSGNSSLNYTFGRSFDQLTGESINQNNTQGSASLNSSILVFQGFQKINQILQNKYSLDANKSNLQKAKNDLSLNVVTAYLQVLSAQDLTETARQQLDLARMQLDREQQLFDIGNKTLADLSQAKAQAATAELNLTNAQNQLDLTFLNLSQLLERNPADKFEVVKPAVDMINLAVKNYIAEEVYRTAVTTYPDIKLAEYRRMAANKAVWVARGSYYPRLTFSGNLGTGYSNRFQQLIEGSNPPAFEDMPLRDQIKNNFSRGFGFNLSIPLWNGYQTRSTVKRAKINFQNASLTEQLAKNTLNKVINQAVYDLKAADKRYASNQSAYQASKTAFEAIEQRYQIGLVNAVDFYQAQLNLNKAEFDLIQAKYDLIFRIKVIDFYLGKPLTF